MPLRRTLAVAFAAAGGAVALTFTSLSSISAAAAPNLAITPASFSVTADGNVTYTATTTDSLGNILDVTAGTTFSITPDGSCSGRFCGSTVSGPHTVTASYQGAAAMASLTVTPGQVTRLVLSPASATIVAGGSQGYTSVAYDRYGNSFGDVTASTTFYVDSTANPPCAGNTCSTTNAGPHQVVGEWNTVAGASPLTVTAGAAAHVTLSPAISTTAAGATQTYTTTATDSFGNSLGDVTAGTTFSLTPDGSCSGGFCGSTVSGPHTVAATYQGVTTTGSQTVTPGTASRLVLSPANATIVAGGSQAYTAVAYDQYGNSFGDVTASTTFYINSTLNPPCAGNTCSATDAGPHQVVGQWQTAVGASSLTVTAGPVDHITLSPATTTAAAGGNQTYVVEAFDQYNNDLGNQTSSSTLAITPDGTCYGISCGATRVGAHTITATYSGKMATASLTVYGGGLDHISLTPASATINAGGSQAYTVESFDAYGNDLGNQTAASALSIAPDGSCTTGSCYATHWGNHAITATYSAKSATASLMVNPNPVVASIGINPGYENLPAGYGATWYIVTADQYGNSIAVVNSGFSLTVGPPTMLCPGTICTVTTAGTYTVTASYQGFTSAGQLVIRPAALDHITLTPATATIVAGGSQGYAVEGFDQYGNDIGSMASSTSLVVSGYSCSSMSCQAFTAGDLTVTATSGGKTATAMLTVKPGPITRLTVSPSTVTMPAQGSQVFTAAGTDAYSNAVNVSGATWSLAKYTPGTLSATTGNTTSFKASSYFTGTGSVMATIGGISASSAITVVPATPSVTANVKPTKVELTWPTAAGAYTYTVYRGTSGSNLTLLKSGLTSTSFTDTPGGGTFYYYVVAVGPFGQQSSPSNIVSATFK